MRSKLLYCFGLVVGLAVLSLLGAGASQSLTAGSTGVLEAGNRIAFVSDRDGNYELYAMTTAGTAQTRLTANTAGDWCPGWSPDASQIAFSSDRDDSYSEIYVMKADGTSQMRLTESYMSDYFPEWSPDGRQIAFESDRGVPGEMNFEVYVMNADGTQQTNITRYPAEDRWPCWSPDGTRIAFASNRDGDFELYVMNANGWGLVKLTQNTANDVWPAWSSDGRQIAFVSDRDGNLEIYVMNADGTGQMNLTRDPSEDGFPTWSPDGRRIAFDTNRTGNFEIYSANVDGTGLVNLTNHPADDRMPAWAPRLGYTFSGRVADGSGNPVSDVTVSAGAGYATTTDGSGNYALSGLAAGAYTIIPSKSGWTFAPASRVVSMPPDATAQDFVGTPVASQVQTLSPQVSSSDPLHQVIARGQVTTTGTTNVWFEWGADPGLASYQITGTQVATTGVVTISLRLPVTDSIGVPYYYRIAAGDPNRPVRGEVIRALLLLGQERDQGQYWAADLFDWNKYDRLIHYYAHQKGIPASIVKAIIAQETDAANRLHNDRPELTFLYEPVTVDFREVHRSGSAPIAPVTYTQYLLPSNPPVQYPYNYFWHVTVPISQETKNLDFVSGCAFPEFPRYGRSNCVGWRQVFSATDWSPTWPQDFQRYQQLWGLANAAPPSDTAKFPVFTAQYRLAASYGLGQVVYWFHKDDRLVIGHTPESLYEPALNIASATDFLSTLKRKLAPTLQETNLDIDKWRSVIIGYNGSASYFAPVKSWFTSVSPFLAPPEFESEILAPASEWRTTADRLWSSPGEHEVERVLADVKGNGQPQLVVLSVLVTDSELGVDTGRLKVFRGVTDSEVEWESGPMENILAVGVAFTTTVAGGGPPILSALWGVGAHGSVLYPFRWDGQTFQAIPAVDQDGQQAFGFFGDAGVDIGEGGIWTGQRDGNQPLSVSHVASYAWEPTTQTFQWMGEETFSNTVYGLFFPLISAPNR